MGFKEEYAEACEVAHLRLVQKLGADLVIQEKRHEAALKRIEALEAENSELREAIGEIQAKHEKLVDRLTKKFEAMANGKELTQPTESGQSNEAIQ